MLNINKKIEADSIIYSLEGRLDTSTSPELEKEIKTIPDDIRDLIFDFEKLDYISSAGLRVLLAAKKSMMDKGDIKIVNANETIMEIFEVTGFADILTIE